MRYTKKCCNLGCRILGETTNIVHHWLRLTRKSKISVRVMAADMSFRWSVLLLFSSEWFQDLNVSSRMNISQACSKNGYVNIRIQQLADIVCIIPIYNKTQRTRLQARHVSDIALQMAFCWGLLHAIASMIWHPCSSNCFYDLKIISQFVS